MPVSAAAIAVPGGFDSQAPPPIRTLDWLDSAHARGSGLLICADWNPLQVGTDQAQPIPRFGERLGTVRKSVEAIACAARTLNAVVQDLVESTRLETGQMSLASGQVDLRRLVLHIPEGTGKSMATARSQFSPRPTLSGTANGRANERVGDMAAVELRQESARGNVGEAPGGER